MKVSKNSFYSFLFFCSLGILCNTIGKILSPTFYGIQTASVIQLLVFLAGFFILGKKNKNFLSPYNIFLTAFYLFQNGQVLLYSLGVEYDYFYVERYEKIVLLNSIIFSTNCLCAALTAGSVVNPKKEFTNRFYTKLNGINRNYVLSLGRILWWIFAIAAVPYMFLKLFITATSGYFAMMEFVSRLPSVVNLLEKMFLGISILLLIYSDRKSLIHKFLTIVLVLWSVMAALAGDRTVGLAGLITIALIRFTIGDKARKKIPITKYFLLAIVGIIVMYLVSIAFSFRMQTDISTGGLQSTIIDVIGTLGFSFFPLVLIMRLYPSQMPFVYGKSFVGGFVSGLLPSTFDFLNITKIFTEWNSEGTKLLDSYYNYGFGLDFSLNAECYMNFGNFGWIAMFLICCLIASLLRQVDYTRKDNLFSQYSVIVLLYSWLTLPRRKSYYLFNNFFWYVFAIGLILLIFTNIQNKKINRKMKGI
ncbi:MAG: O-antigen polysaccharide polymerase Wzy family protein [Erysipelotrichaceae bacterium]